MLVGHAVGNAQGVILAMDEAVCDLLHRTKAQAIGLSYLDLTHPDDRVSNTRNVAALRLDCAPSLIRKRYLRPDNSFVTIDLEASRLSGPAGEDRLVGTIRLALPMEGVSRPERMRARARQAVELAQRRNIELGSEMSGDHAWLMLLQIYLAEIECRIVDLGKICEVMNFQKSVSIRWMQALLAKGLIEKSGGIAALQLTATGFAAIERALDLDN